MIKIENVTYRYKRGKDILKNVNLEIQDKETVVVMGKNGSGKSTLGKLIAGIIKPKEGKILIHDFDITDKKKKEELRKKVGIVFQNPENQILFNNIQDEVSFALKNLEEEEKRKRIEASLEKVNMLDKIDEDLYELSLGQKQRVIIGEVLAKQPQIIVFDEPTTMIDSKGKEEIYKIVQNLKKEGYTIIYITNLAEEMLLADRIVLLNEGEIVEEIKKEEILDKIEVFEQYDVKIPMILELMQKLKQAGIEIHLEHYSLDELVEKWKELTKG
ncbi:MAG: ATP-binding cassette domain-containing protein [Clostridia bacterium]|nr:ATP-binding cassette domain-containing protein [Clostridia bacterium]